MLKFLKKYYGYKYSGLIFLTLLLLLTGTSQAADLPKFDIPCDQIESINIFKLSEGIGYSEGDCSDGCYFVTFFQNNRNALAFNNWVNDHQGFFVDINVNNIPVVTSIELPSMQPMKMPVSRYFQAAETFHSREDAYRYAEKTCPELLNKSKEELPWMEPIK